MDIEKKCYQITPAQVEELLQTLARRKFCIIHPDGISDTFIVFANHSKESTCWEWYTGLSAYIFYLTRGSADELLSRLFSFEQMDVCRPDGSLFSVQFSVLQAQAE